MARATQSGPRPPPGAATEVGPGVSIDDAATVGGVDGLDQRQVRPRPGSGLLARLPGLVAAIDTPEPTASGADPAALVLDACRQAAVGGPTVGEALWVRLEALHAAAVTALPAFAVVADGPGGRVVALAHGAASVRAAGPSGSNHLRGDPEGVARRELDGAMTTVEVVLDELVDTRTDEEPSTRAELALGVVAAAGGRILTATARLGAEVGRESTPCRSDGISGVVSGEPPTTASPATRPGPEPAEPAGSIVRPRHADRADFVSVALVAADTGRDVGGPPPTAASTDLDGVVTADGEAARRPLPIAGAPTDDEPAPDPTGEPIPGLRCIEGHLNDPADPSCRVCGAPLAARAGSLETGPRPPLGLLVFDDGAGFVLDDDYVIGRAPTEDARVRSGRARPLVVVDDEGRSVSRVHAEIRLDGWQVLVADRGSTNGTFVWESGAWTRLTPSEPRRLRPGDRVAVGQRVCTVEVTGASADRSTDSNVAGAQEFWPRR
jgi:hypothetical protein